MSIKDQGLQVDFESHFLRFERTDKAIAAEVARRHNTQDGLVKVHRNLFLGCDQPLKVTLAAIETVREVHERNSVPWGTSRAVRIEHYPTHRDRTKDALAQFDVALKAFHDVYPDMVKTGIANSNGTCQPSEYISQDEIYQKFSVSITYSQLTDAADWLKATMLTPEEQSELVAQTKLSEQRNVLAMKDGLKDQFCKILVQARDNLMKTTTKEAGKRFNVGWLLNLQQFCDLWPGLNLDSDPLIPIMIADLQPILKHSMETMKTSESAKIEAITTLNSFIAKHDAWLNS